jgi:hypothetical protein
MLLSLSFPKTKHPEICVKAKDKTVSKTSRLVKITHLGSNPIASVCISDVCSMALKIWTPRTTGMKTVVIFSGFNAAHSSWPGTRRLKAGESFVQSLTQLPQRMQF